MNTNHETQARADTDLGDPADTTTLAARPEIRASVEGTLLKRGRPRAELQDDVAEVLTRALDAARSGRMPQGVDDWRLLATTIAERYAIDEGRRASVRLKYDEGLCQNPDERGPRQGGTPRDPVDTKRYLEVLGSLFQSGRMPEKGAEILWGVAEGVPQREIGEETGLSGRQVDYRLARMRRVFAEELENLRRGVVANRLVADVPIVGGADRGKRGVMNAGCVIDSTGRRSDSTGRCSEG